MKQQLNEAYMLAPIESVILHPQNPRIGDVDVIRESIRVNGFYGALVVQKSTNYVIVGNHRLKAARLEKLDEVPIVFVDVSDEEAVRIMLADNRTSDLGTYDLAQQVALMQNLDSLEGTGYQPEDLDSIIRELEASQPRQQLNDPDDAPPIARTTKIKEGSVWALGPHRVVCGDASDPVAWGLLMGDRALVDMVWTDPPYGVAYEGGTDEKLTIKNDNLGIEALTELLRDSLGLAFEYCRPGGAWYVASPQGPLNHVFGTVLLELKVWRHGIVWMKDSLVLGRGDYHYKHEPIFYGYKEGADHVCYLAEHSDIAYGWKPGAPHHAVEDRKFSTVWEFARPKASKDHPTMKPVALIQRAIENSSEPGAIVCDPFAGSGSTLMAAHDSKRVGYCLELDPLYVDVIIRRWEKHSGEKATQLG